MKNTKFLYLEAFFATFVGIAGTFNGVYAIRLGATDTQIGLLNSIPSLLVTCVSLPMGRFLQKQNAKLFWALGGITIYRLGYMVLAFAPLVSAAGISPGFLVVIILSLIAIPIQFFNIGNIGMMIDAVPEENRAAIFTNRNIIGVLTTSVGVFIAGLYLDRIKFPLNYQILFFSAGAISQMSLYCWLKIKFQDNSSTILEKTQTRLKGSIVTQFTSYINAFRVQPLFTRFILNSLFSNVGLWMAGTLYILYIVRVLKATDGWIGISGTIGSLCSFLGILLGRRLIEYWGEPVTQRKLALIVGLYPFLVGISPSLIVILIFSGVYNLITPGFSLSTFNLWLKIIPDDRREDAAALYNTIMNIGPIIFPLVGISLSGIFGLPLTLIGCGILAFLGSISYWIWKIDPELK